MGLHTMNKYDAYLKVSKVVKSCKTKDQLLIAIKMHKRFFKMYCPTFKDELNRSLCQGFINHPLVKSNHYTTMAQIHAWCNGHDYYYRVVDGEFVRHNLRTGKPVAPIYGSIHHPDLDNGAF